MEAVAAILIAAIIFLVLFYAFSSRRIWGKWWVLFLILFLFIWAASFWLVPLGPVYGGIAWSSLIYIGLILGILVLAIKAKDTTSTEKNGTSREKRNQTKEEKKATKGIKTLLWVFTGLLLFAIVLGYIGLLRNS